MTAKTRIFKKLNNGNCNARTGFAHDYKSHYYEYGGHADLLNRKEKAKRVYTLPLLIFPPIRAITFG